MESLNLEEGAKNSNSGNNTEELPTDYSKKAGSENAIEALLNS